MEENFAATQLLASARCTKEFEQWKSCGGKAAKKEDCLNVMKEFQFCMTRRNEEMLQVNETFEKFKAKWGHYPNESR